MSDYFPDDLLEKIILFLPAESLVRFCCVSKSWKSRITSSDFIHTHLNLTRISTEINGNNLLLLKHNDKPKFEQYSLRFDNDGLDLHTILDCPFHVDGDNYFGVLGSVNGLVCLSDDLHGKTDHYILWNPSIRNYITLPLPTKGPNVAVGFGYDSRSKDYKIVSLQSHEYKPHRPEIFKLSRGSWETISATIDKYWVKYDNHVQLFLHGKVHWNAYKTDSRVPVILTFDMCDEVFGELILPACYAELDSSRVFYVAICDERLSLICDSWLDTGNYANSLSVNRKEI